VRTDAGEYFECKGLFKRADQDRKRSKDWKAKLAVVGLEIK